MDIDRVFQDTSGSVAKMLDELDNRMHHELTRMSLHDLYVIGDKRQEISLTVRQVLRANVDRVSRAVGRFPQRRHQRIPRSGSTRCVVAGSGGSAPMWRAACSRQS